MASIKSKCGDRLPLNRGAVSPAELDAWLQDVEPEPQHYWTRAIEAGLLLSAEAFAVAMGDTAQDLERRTASFRVFSIEVNGELFYPAFFLGDALERKRHASICKELGALDGASKWQFFTAPKGSLGVGVTPLEALRRGRYGPVRRAAIAFRE